MTFLRSKTVLLLTAAIIGLTFPSPARAEIVYAERISVETAVATCDGGLIVLTGEFHTLVATATDGNGGLHFVFHGNAANLVGTDPVTGTTYRGTRTDTGVTNITDGARTYTSRMSFNLIGQGPDNNLRIRFLYHFTIHPDNTYSATVSHVETVCESD